jgi:hypothetical protein
MFLNLAFGQVGETIKAKTGIAAMKAFFLYFNLCLSIMLDSLPCLFTSIFFLTNYMLVYMK